MRRPYRAGRTKSTPFRLGRLEPPRNPARDGELAAGAPAVPLNRDLGDRLVDLEHDHLGEVRGGAAARADAEDDPERRVPRAEGRAAGHRLRDDPRADVGPCEFLPELHA